MEPAWDFATLWAWFGNKTDEDVLETELLRAFFGDPFAQGRGLELFQKHFLLYRRLWIFDDELRQRSGHRLWIRGIRCTLRAPQLSGLCQHFDLDSGDFCQSPCTGSLCLMHSQSLPEVNSLKSYYLDWANFEGMDDEKLREMVDGFFRWMGRQADVAPALAVLGLPPDATWLEVKTRWKQLSLDHHPDRGGDQAHFQTLSAAYTTLKVAFTS